MRHIQEDNFQKLLTGIVSLYYHQRQKFLIGVGVIVVIIVAAIVIISGRGKENPEVQLRFTEALGLYSVNQVDQAEEKFVDFSRRFGSHYLAAKAHFYIGNINFTRQEYDKARKEFEKAYGKVKNDPVIGPATLMAIGNCYEETKNLRKALEVYEQVYNRYKKSALGQEALINAGRCAKDLNDLNRAEKIYQRAVKELPPGETAEQAKFQLAYIKALKEKF